MTIVKQPAAGLPQLSGPTFLTDGGLETTLVFEHGLDLPAFAAFPLLTDDAGRAALRRYYVPYLEIAREHGRGLVLDTPTWRANADWGETLGYDREQLAAVNEQGVAFVTDLAAACADVRTVVNGVVGPRGDGYALETAMSVDEATDYHRDQVAVFAGAGADMVTAVTMTSAAEGAGVARAAREAGIPVAIGVTVEIDGRLPSGESLATAVEVIDDASDGWAAYLMINCAHPSHFVDRLEEGAPWLARIQAIRANASRLSHAELDEAEELDRGNPAELARDYATLRSLLPELRVVGGCCGTDAEHVAAIATALGSGG